MNDLQLAEDFLRLMIGKIGLFQAAASCAWNFPNLPISEITSLAIMIGE